MSVLNEICDKKREHVAYQKSTVPLAEHKAIAADQLAPRGFIDALKQAPFPAIIAEIKKASPSKGIIRADFNPTDIVRIYDDNGAACMSVLTDTPYFQGSDDIFRSVRAVTDTPLLRKDFMVDSYQIHEARAMGADCILLIMAALEDNQAEDFYGLASDLGMDTLFEVHDEAELDRAIALKPQMVGVNNRNLKTMDVTVETSKALATHMPDHVLKLSESGLADYSVLQDLSAHGYQGFLIGESLMRQSDIGHALRAIRGQ